jgi:hypothetical protein
LHWSFIVPSRQYLVPYIISNLFALALIAIAVKWPGVARVLVGVGFFAAACANTFAAIRHPQDYLGYAPLAALSIYRNFIQVYFSHNPALFVIPIAICQLIIGLLVHLTKGRWLKLGLTGGIVFLLAIMPLGVGSAFPATLLMAIALVVLFKHESAK